MARTPLSRSKGQRSTCRGWGHIALYSSSPPLPATNATAKQSSLLIASLRHSIAYYLTVLLTTTTATNHHYPPQRPPTAIITITNTTTTTTTITDTSHQPRSPTTNHHSHKPPPTTTRGTWLACEACRYYSDHSIIHHQVVVVSEISNVTEPTVHQSVQYSTAVHY